MKYIKGNLLTEKFDVIAHGCNCLTIMGGGIAKQIKETYPSAFEADDEFEYYKPGNFSFTEVTDLYMNNGVADVRKKFIANAYTQEGLGYCEQRMSLKNTQEHRLQLIKSAFSKIKKQFGNMNLTFGIPLIGAGIAQGNFDDISKVIEDELFDEDITVVIWEKDYDNLNRFNL